MWHESNRIQLELLGPQTFRLLEKVSWVIVVEGRRFLVEISPGFVYDGGTIPRIAWLFLAPLDWPLAFTLHDALYASEAVPRCVADDAFLDAAKATGACWIERRVAYRCVREAGWLTYRNHTPESIAEARRYITIQEL